MIENQTSQAARNLLGNPVRTPQGDAYLPHFTALAIAAKHQRMEEALKRMNSEETDWENGEIGVGHRFRAIAKEALAFDPLAA